MQSTPSPYESLDRRTRDKITERLSECRYRWCESTPDSIAADIIATRARALAGAAA